MRSEECLDLTVERIKPSQFDPGTQVYKLVECLLSYLDE